MEAQQYQSKTYNDLIAIVANKNFKMCEDDNRPLLKSLHQRAIWQKLQQKFNHGIIDYDSIIRLNEIVE